MSKKYVFRIIESRVAFLTKLEQCAEFIEQKMEEADVLFSPFHYILGGLLGPLGASVGASWGLLGPSWGGRLGLSVQAPPLGPLLGPSWGPLGPLLGLSWAVLGPS